MLLIFFLLFALLLLFPNTSTRPNAYPQMTLKQAATGSSHSFCNFSSVTLAPMDVTSRHGKNMVPFREDKFFVNSGLNRFFRLANAPKAHITNNFATARNAARNISRKRGSPSEEEGDAIFSKVFLKRLLFTQGETNPTSRERSLLGNLDFGETKKRHKARQKPKLLLRFLRLRPPLLGERETKGSTAFVCDAKRHFFGLFFL